MKFITTFGLALGVGTTVAGGLAFDFGLNTNNTIFVSGLGPFDGQWDSAVYCFLGTILASLGAGLSLFTLVWTLLFLRHGRPVAPRRRWLFGSLVLALGIAGAGAGGMSLLSQQQPKLSESDAELARIQVAVFMTQLSDGKSVKVMTTPDYHQREQTERRLVRYEMMTFRISTTEFRDSQQVVVTGKITATAKTTTTRFDGDFVVGTGLEVSQFDSPKTVGFTVKLVKGETNPWLVNEVVFQEQ